MARRSADSNHIPRGWLTLSLQRSQARAPPWQLVVVLSEAEWKAQLRTEPFMREHRLGQGKRGTPTHSPYFRIAMAHQKHHSGPLGWL